MPGSVGNDQHGHHSPRCRGAALVAGVGICLLWGSGGCSDDTDPSGDSAIPDAAVIEGGADAITDAPVAGELSVVILFTNDLHGHLLGFGPNADYTPAAPNDDATEGGFARLAARVSAERTAAGQTPVLLLDSGDFMMGSIFGWLETTLAPTLSLMQRIGYDALTLGNHELDWGPGPLATVLAAGVEAGFSVPIVAGNLSFDADEEGDDSLEALVEDETIRPKLVKTLGNGLKVGIFGLMGDDAATLAVNAAPLGFGDAVEAATAMVKELREQDGVDLVICLSHSGIGADGEGEDKELAAAVPGIDVIISGHNHVALPNAVQVGKTVIVQTGKYGKKLGKLRLTITEGTVSFEHELIAIDDTVQGDATVHQAIQGYIQALDEELQPAGLAFDAVIAETAFDLAYPHDLDGYFTETILGNVVTDAYLQAHNALYPAEPADCSIESQGIIRDPVLAGKTGKLWLADIYRALPLYLGPDGQPGTPLVSVYLNGKDLKAAMELLNLAEGLLNSPPFFLQLGGMQVEYIKGGIPTMTVTSITVNGQPVDFADTSTCYKVVTNLELARSLELMSAATAGALSVEAKAEDCATVIDDISTRLVDADPATPGVQELKAWRALVSFLQSLPDGDGDGIPDLPASYADLQDRIVAQ